MAGKRYSAGRIFLQVVPSFNNFHREVAREVARGNGPLEKQAEEQGKRQEQARARGMAKARVRTVDEELRENERIQRERIRQYQKFTQAYLGEVAKEGTRNQKARDDFNRRLGAAELAAAQRRKRQEESDRADAIRRYQKFTQAMISQRVAEAKAQEAEDKRAHDAAVKRFQRDTEEFRRLERRRQDAMAKVRAAADAERRRLHLRMAGRSRRSAARACSAV